MRQRLSAGRTMLVADLHLNRDICPRAEKDGEFERGSDGSGGCSYLQQPNTATAPAVSASSCAVGGRRRKKDVPIRMMDRTTCAQRRQKAGETERSWAAGLTMSAVRSQFPSPTARGRRVSEWYDS